MSSRLPPGIEFQKDFFRQADFIEVALENILHALRDGALLVFVVLFLFLGNFPLPLFRFSQFRFRCQLPFSFSIKWGGIKYHDFGRDRNSHRRTRG